MSFTPMLNIVVLGDGERAAAYLTAIQALHAEGSVVLASGLRVMLEAAFWHPDPAVVQELATRFHLGLYGVDPRVMIDAGDIHAVVACFSDPEQQAEALDRAIAAGKILVAEPPLAPSERETWSLIRRARRQHLLTAIAQGSAEATIRAFVRGLLERRTLLPTWEEWLEGTSPRPLSPREEIERALAVLPADASEARAHLLRALAQLPEE